MRAEKRQGRREKRKGKRSKSNVTELRPTQRVWPVQSTQHPMLRMSACLGLCSIVSLLTILIILEQGALHFYVAVALLIMWPILGRILVRKLGKPLSFYLYTDYNHLSIAKLMTLFIWPCFFFLTLFLIWPCFCSPVFRRREELQAFWKGWRKGKGRRYKMDRKDILDSPLGGSTFSVNFSVDIYWFRYFC